MYDAASLATIKFIVARNTVMYVLCTQLHTPRGVGMTKWGTKKAACGQALRFFSHGRTNRNNANKKMVVNTTLCMTWG